MLRRLTMLVLALTLAATAAAGTQDYLRPAAKAGTWYPAQKEVLRASLQTMLAAANPPRVEGRLYALIVPHAGHIYSGRVAAAAYALLARHEPRPRSVILVGPSHHYPLRRPSIWPRGAYACPLGNMAVDAELAGELSRLAGARFVRQAHLPEHCLEVQVPFLRLVLPQARLVAVLTGPPGLDSARRLGHALAKVARGRPVVLIASSDLSHFHPQAQARRLDEVVAARVEALDPEGLWRAARERRAEACGLQAVMAVMFAARELGAKQGVILARDDSSRVSGDRSRVVGYLAAALVGPAGSTSPAEPAAQSWGLDPARRRLLRDLARRAVEAAVRGRPLPTPPRDDPVLKRPAGVFVTLKRHGRLRGCIGTIAARWPLARAVVEMARAAALHDPRFRPVSPEELGDLELEISVLTPLHPCRPQQVQVGRDGLMIEMDGRRGLLLPQVPVEWGWDRRRFLEGVCRKAGLPSQAWRSSRARLSCFQALVF